MSIDVRKPGEFSLSDKIETEVGRIPESGFQELAAWVWSAGELGNLPPATERIYFGTEFCERLLPGSDSIRELFEKASGKGLKFTLVTSFLTDSGLDSLVSGLDKLRDILEEIEIVINDYGLLRVLHNEFGNSFSGISLGRLLNRMKRGPRLTEGDSRFSHQVLEHFRSSGVDFPDFSEFLSGLGVTRIELDHPLAGLKRKNAILSASLHYPYVFVATGRYCQSADPFDRERHIRSVSCKVKGCRKMTFSVKGKGFPVPLIVKGATWFYQNDRLPRDPASIGVTRLVIASEPPL